MKILFSLAFVLISIMIFGQNNIEEVVYLKNGSIIRGTIIEQVPNQTLKIQTKDGSVFVFNLNEVQKITKEVPYSNPVNTNTQVTNQSNNENIVNNTDENTYSATDSKEKKEYLKKGFLGITELGAIGRKHYNSKSAFTFHQLIAKRTSQNFSIGMGFGVETNTETLVVPVMLDTRIYFMKNRISPFMNLAPGYAFMLFNFKYYNYNRYYEFSETYHTFITNIGLGVEFKINQKVGVSFNTGARMTLIPDIDFGASGFVKFGIIY